MLDPNALTIGFARRFATYKRADLILRDLERLAEIVNATDRPIQIIFAGKAHPEDQLRQGADPEHRPDDPAGPQFASRIVFVEDYDINVARHLVQGVDVWLNNPRRPQEASGTSGEKAVLNGGLNFSILDGWWAEAYDGTNGFAIGNGQTHSVPSVQDERDDEALIETLVERGRPALLRPRRRRPAARLDRPPEERAPHPGLAVQRRPHGDGLRPEQLPAGGRRALVPDDPGLTARPPCRNPEPTPGRDRGAAPPLAHVCAVNAAACPARTTAVDLGGGGRSSISMDGTVTPIRDARGETPRDRDPNHVHRADRHCRCVPTRSRRATPAPPTAACSAPPASARGTGTSRSSRSATATSTSSRATSTSRRSATTSRSASGRRAACRSCSTRSASTTASRWATTGMKYSLPSRELIADCVETMIEAHLLRRR